MDSDQAARFKEIRRILLFTLALNWAVAIAKIAYGLITRFTSMTADGFHSLSDGASNIIGLIGVTLACRPADKYHPYGYKKYETLFALGIAGLLFLACFELASKAIERFHHPINPKIDIGSLIVTLGTMAVNIFVMSYEYKQGKRLNSDILVSDSAHTKADIFTSLSVIAAMIVIKMGYPILDPIVTFMIALFIAYTAFSIARQSSNILCDAIMLDDKRVANVVLSIKGVEACHKIRTRGRIDDIHIDLHVQVNPDMRVDKAHQISYQIENAVKGGIHGVTDVVVHIEPQKKNR
ncbi:MAG: cation transporter [Omnitrophica bacterium RIFCSPLOWO2_12_FULL_45_13]|nr:MAG: cation transporter [Omnitrophica bacterium RIFCSPLOWO2_12_FULL_45_13]